MYHEPTEEPQYQDELEDKYVEVMRNNAVAKYGYDAAGKCGLSEEMRLKAAIVALHFANQGCHAKR